MVGQYFPDGVIIMKNLYFRLSSQLINKVLPRTPYVQPISNHQIHQFRQFKPFGSASLTFANKFHMSIAQKAHENVLKSSYTGDGFYIQQLFTGCLAIYSYYIQSGDECFLIDPLIETDKYIQLINSRGKKLAGIFNTHYHADFVSGQYELQKKYNCKLYMGPSSLSSDKLTPLKDKQTIQLGNIGLQCWHTPGHTEESSCLLLVDKKEKRTVIFTGDTVFLNEVGRPDLAVKSDLSQKQLASMLFASLQKLKNLEDDIRIYPGHGSGSSCGKSIGKGDFCTLGLQKENNYGLKINDQTQFMSKVLMDMPAPPKYFGYNVNLNKFQPFFYQQKSQKAFTKLSVEEVNTLRKEKDVFLVDIRSSEQLKKGIIKGSLCIGFDGGFANWVGSLLNPQERIIVIGNGNQEEAIKRLFRIGFINVVGYNHFSIEDWKAKQMEVTLPDFQKELVLKDTLILDVRKPDQWQNDGKVQNSIQFELSDLFHNPQRLQKNKAYIVHCKSGYRAKIAWSYLTSLGFTVKAYPQSFDSIFKQNIAKKVDYQQ